MQPYEIGRLTRLELGYVGETGTREILIDMTEWLERWPDGNIAVDVLKPGRKEYYLADTMVEDGILTWTVTYADVAKAGRGMAQISLYDFATGKVYKSRCVETIIKASADMEEDLEAPHPMDTWVARAVAAKEEAIEASEAAMAAEQGAEANAEEAAGHAQAAAAQLELVTAEGARQTQLVQTEGATQAERLDERAEELLATADEIIADGMAPIIGELEGKMVSIVDAAERPAKQVTTKITPKQSGSGDPTPDNVRAISGWDTVSLTRTGKNILPYSDYSGERKGVTFTSNNNGTYTLNGTATADAFYRSKTNAFELGVLPAGDYTVSVVPASAVWNVRARIVRSDNQVTVATTSRAEGVITFTADGVTDYSAGFYVVSGGTMDNVTVSIQMERGGTATEHEMYKGQVLGGDLPETVYSGTIDWENGILTVTHALGEVTAFDALYTQVGSGLTCGQANKWPGMRIGGGADGWCEMLRPVGSIANRTGACVSFGGTSSQAIYAAYPSTLVGTTLESLNAYVAGTPLRVVYPLQTPYTVQLTPQQLELLKGCNNVWSDNGDTTLVYLADTKLYIDKVVGVLYEMFFNAMA